MISTADVLRELGFQEYDNPLANDSLGYVYDFGNLQLEAAEIFRLGPPVILLSGNWSDARSVGTVRFEMPRQVETFELGVALIAHGIGMGFVPKKPCSWLKQGREWRHHLPWLKDLEAYETRPKCTVEREWFKLVARRLRELAAHAGDDMAVVTFDGEILRFQMSDEVLAVQAKGEVWDEAYQVPLVSFASLPQRLMHPVVHIDVWNETLGVGSRRFPMAAMKTEEKA